MPLVLFRDEHGKPAALLDRCAHRNLPLSVGHTVRGRLECAYHGWQYDGSGVCRAVPALAREREAFAAVPAHAVTEQQGYVWVFARAGVEPPAEPYRFPHLDEAGYTTVRTDCEVRATLHATLENQLDVPHTAFLHRGLFRGGRKSRITVAVRRFGDRAEAEYVGEPRPSGLVARLLAPSGGTVTHVDRFLLPSIAQVEYRLGESHLVVTNALTPVDDMLTRFASVVSFRLPVPGTLARLVITPLVKRILEQDRRILELQSDASRRFGGEHYTSTEADVLGPHVWWLLRRAAEGPPAPADEQPFEKRIELLA
jgi:phenylpropionate dioxygenase-like ring-hydroxylating dioxygenase large terminal subunit